METLPPSAGYSFGASVHSRTWEWLSGLRRPLDVDLQIVDEHHAAGVTHAAGSGPDEIVRLVDSGSPLLRGAVSSSVRTGLIQSAVVDSVQIVSCPLKSPSGNAGALVVARRLGVPDKTPEQTADDLERIATWLWPAIQAHLFSSPAVEATGLDRLSSLEVLLSSAAANASDRETVAGFAEVMAVWHDVDTYGYVETERGTFVREVMLPGIDPSTAPAAVHPAILPEPIGSARLATVDPEALGFTRSEDVVAVRLTPAGGARSWLLLLGPVRPDDVPRLRLYITLLEHWVTHTAATAVTRVVTGMSPHLLGSDESLETCGERALATLRGLLPLESVAWAVSDAAGTPLLRLAAGAASPDAPVAAGSGEKIRRRSDAHVMSLDVTHAEGRHMTPQELQALEAAADLLEPWTRRVTPATRQFRERRASARRFDDVMETLARQALEHGNAVSVLTVRLGLTPDAPAVVQHIARQIRSHLRSVDLVGVLGDRDIAVLLQDADKPHSMAVAERVQRLVAIETSAAATLGVATWNPGDALPVALVQQAREQVNHRYVV